MKNINGGGKKENKSIVNMKADQAPTKSHSKGKGKLTPSSGSSSNKHSKPDHNSQPHHHHHHHHHPNGVTKNGFHPNGTQPNGTKITTAVSSTKPHQAPSTSAGFKSFASVVTSTLPNKTSAPLPLGFLPTAPTDQSFLKGADHSPYLAAASFGRKGAPANGSESSASSTTSNSANASGAPHRETQSHSSNKHKHNHHHHHHYHHHHSSYQNNNNNNNTNQTQYFSNSNNCSLQESQPLVDSEASLSNYTEDDKPPTIPRLGEESREDQPANNTTVSAVDSSSEESNQDASETLKPPSASEPTSTCPSPRSNSVLHETVNTVHSPSSPSRNDRALEKSTSTEDPQANDSNSVSFQNGSNPHKPFDNHPHSNGFAKRNGFENGLTNGHTNGHTNGYTNGYVNGTSYYANGRYRNGKPFHPRYRIDYVPWMHLPNLSVPSSFHEEIWNFYKYISPTPEELKMRNEVLKRVTAVIMDLWPSAEIKVFGSYATQSLLPTSDIDIVVMGAQATHSQPIFALSEELLKHKGMTKLHVIPTAKVPVIKMTDTQTGCLVDISFNLNSGPENAKLMLEHFDRYPFLLPIAVLIKYFLYMRGLNEPYKGGVGSFTLLLMIVSLLQQRAKVKRDNGEDEEETDLSSVLLAFLEFYGRSFDYHTYGISIRDGGFFFLKKDRDWYDSENPDLLAIEDPSNEANDVGRLSFGMLDVKFAFDQAYRDLTDALHRHHPGEAYKSVLRNIVWIEPWLEEQRRYIAMMFGEQSTKAELGLNGTTIAPRLRRPSITSTYNTGGGKRKNHNNANAVNKDVVAENN